MRCSIGQAGAHCRAPNSRTRASLSTGQRLDEAKHELDAIVEVDHPDALDAASDHGLTAQLLATCPEAESLPQCAELRTALAEVTEALRAVDGADDGLAIERLRQAVGRQVPTCAHSPCTACLSGVARDRDVTSAHPGATPEGQCG